MDDKYKELREAAKAATPGPWFTTADKAAIWHPDTGRVYIVPNRSAKWNWEADIQHIAAANPATIQALLAERDALRSALIDLVAVCEPNIYPQPDKPKSDWAKLEAARAALAL